MLNGFERFPLTMTVGSSARVAADPNGQARIETSPMSCGNLQTSEERRLRFEQFEKRLVMSAQAVASVLPELETNDAGPPLTQLVAAESPTTQAANIAAEYGFDGRGQTVAVIDSGIAFDHFALGGGFGEDYRVVGGYDFAEGDDNPYDDGPAGFHGTHVAGIIGSSDETYRGVSSGVDLVALRVFDDAGRGSIEWVEQALQWVHENQNSFENPITTVNLSLGIEFNADSLPDLAILEDEFAALEADGLFISVAAGNSFLSFGEQGLSYPAVSPSVVPVASHGADGTISDFSQRADNVLVAPGELIRSTVPGHLFGQTTSERFLATSGTSQAAPFVAGASAILRQANEFVGTENINQDLLYQQLRDSADQVFDAVTGQYYHNVNLRAALESIIQDVHGDSFTSATDAGVLQGGEVINGTIGTLLDTDTFVFTAGQTGRTTLTFDVTHDLVAAVEVLGSDAQINGNEISFDVVAGQEYRFAVTTDGGTGHYEINVSHESATPAKTLTVVDLGTVVSGQFNNQQLAGEANFQVTAARNGLLTIESSVGSAAEALTIEIYDHDGNLLQTRDSQSGSLRFDLDANEGETFLVRAIGASESIDLRVSNFVALESGNLFVEGTDGDDAIVVSAEQDFFVSVNGVEYEFERSAISTIAVTGNAGEDSLELNLGADNDRVSTWAGGLRATNQRFRVLGFDFESTQVAGGGGFDTVTLTGTAGNDQLVARPDQDVDAGYSTTLSGNGFSSQVSGFEFARVRSSGGFDTATIVGTEGDDFFSTWDRRNFFRTADTLLVTDGQIAVSVDGGGGNDSAQLADSRGDDRFVLSSDGGSIFNHRQFVSFRSFEDVEAYSNFGNDSVELRGVSGDELFVDQDGFNVLQGDGYVFSARGFASVTTSLIDPPSSETNGFSIGPALQTSAPDQVETQTPTQSESNTATSSGNIDFGLAYVDAADEVAKTTPLDQELERTLQMLRLTNDEVLSLAGEQNTQDESGELNLLASLGPQAETVLHQRRVVDDQLAALEANSIDTAIADYDLEAVDYLHQLRNQWKQ